MHGNAKEFDVSLPVLAIAWCLKNPRVSTVILGASKVPQLEENLTAIEAQDLFSEDVMAHIEARIKG